MSCLDYLAAFWIKYWDPKMHLKELQDDLRITRYEPTKSRLREVEEDLSLSRQELIKLKQSFVTYHKTRTPKKDFSVKNIILTPDQIAQHREIKGRLSMLQTEQASLVSQLKEDQEILKVNIDIDAAHNLKKTENILYAMDRAGMSTKDMKKTQRRVAELRNKLEQKVMEVQGLKIDAYHDSIEHEAKMNEIQDENERMITHGDSTIDFDEFIGEEYLMAEEINNPSKEDMGAYLENML